MAAAVIGHFRGSDRSQQPLIAGVEPIRAACMLESVVAGEPGVVPGPHTSIMSGLNCGIPSPLAWPIVSRGADMFLTVGDERVRAAMALLETNGVVAGECGAAGLAGLLLLRESGRWPGGVQSVLLISTEGNTGTPTKT